MAVGGTAITANPQQTDWRGLIELKASKTAAPTTPTPTPEPTGRHELRWYPALITLPDSKCLLPVA